MYFNKKIIYVIEDADWVIKWEGQYLIDYLNNKFKVKSALFNIADHGILHKFKKKIIHFGSRSTYLPENYKSVDKSNKVILTWFHGTDEDKEFIEALPEGSNRADIVHTASSLSKKDLMRWGVKEEKIVIIPIGVDLSIFNPVDPEEKVSIKKDLGIPASSICIGSFQKDGNGWQEGNTPKLIKGPDVFCDVVNRLSKDYPLFILLTGPARGYVKNRLKASGIDFKHIYIKDYNEIGKYYKAIDYYIISSRVEGGPKALLECFATGIPFATTRVGMVDDLVIDGHNSLVSEVEDTDSLYNNIKKLIDDKKLKDRLIKNGLETAKQYDWPNIANMFFEKIYSRLL